MEADFIKTIEVVTKKGRILGEDTGIYQVFRSIAYARAPVGELRWKRPQPVEPWEGIYDATLFKTRCPQRLPQEYAPPEELYNKEFYNNYDFIPVRSENSLHLIYGRRIAVKRKNIRWLYGFMAAALAAVLDLKKNLTARLTAKEM